MKFVVRVLESQVDQLIEGFKDNNVIIEKYKIIDYLDNDLILVEINTIKNI